MGEGLSLMVECPAPYPHLVNGPSPTRRSPASTSPAGPGSSFLPTLEGRHYTDPAMFQEEQARIFSAVWICAVRATDLPSTGDFQTVEVGGESNLPEFNDALPGMNVGASARGGAARHPRRQTGGSWTYF